MRWWKNLAVIIYSFIFIIRENVIQFFFIVHVLEKFKRKYDLKCEHLLNATISMFREQKISKEAVRKTAVRRIRKPVKEKKTCTKICKDQN